MLGEIQGTSKGGFSFVHLNDGSCLSNLQVVADGELENYESEIEKLGVCSMLRASSLLLKVRGGP